MALTVPDYASVMASRTAACSCGQLRVEVEGDPVRVSICHCLECQRRTGSVFGVQARFDAAGARIEGRHSDYARTSDESDRRVHVFHFCPDCGGTVFYTSPDEPDMVAVPVGVFADPSFPMPQTSYYDSRRHPWVDLPAGIETDRAWAEIVPLYEAGRYAEAADRGRELVEADPGSALLAYNVACCESLAGRPQDAIAHLRLALARSDQLREQAAEDTDLDALRGDPAFAELLRS
jgi:hypothetical protein